MQNSVIDVFLKEPCFCVVLCRIRERLLISISKSYFLNDAQQLSYGVLLFDHGEDIWLWGIKHGHDCSGNGLLSHQRQIVTWANDGSSSIWLKDLNHNKIEF